MKILQVNCQGKTRTVVVIGSWAFKFGRGDRGRRGNRYEADQYQRANAHRRAILCPVLWCSPHGAVLIARAAVPLTAAERDDLFSKDAFPDWGYVGLGDEVEPFEYKPSDWGWLDGKLVALDYAAPALFADEETRQFRAKASSAHRATDIYPESPDRESRGFAIGAGECLMAAKALNTGILSDATGQYILTFQAIELGLKAFLLKTGMNIASLRRKPYGHDLAALFNEAVRRGFAPDVADADKWIEWANEWHCDDAKLRYEFIQDRHLPICAELFPLVESIIKASGF